ncbi:IGK protein, partial [Thinocorus orbignyianus]|nr:IGK protein [Thinocorus orbignyianus]
NTIIHWYQQKEGKAPERILFFTEGKASVESGFHKNRYMVENVSGQKRCVLTIKDVVPDDTATYYCAYWDPHCDGYYSKVFGSGTKLIVSDKLQSRPANFEILQKEHKNQLIYVCLIEKFYPDVIRVTWTDEENKKVTDNIVKGDAWKPPEEDKYSISSWLTVPVESKDKNYYCNYEHESGKDSLTKQEKPNLGILHSFIPLDPSKSDSQGVDCSMYPGNGTLFNRDPLYHRTAYLVYIVLLLKSSMYYLIVLLFIYR